MFSMSPNWKNNAVKMWDGQLITRGGRRDVHPTFFTALFFYLLRTWLRKKVVSFFSGVVDLVGCPIYAILIS